ncbi:MAG: KOW motif-containing protein, partial [Thermoguttaceae bacterium]|nr:KOW motif-containing protein [Thermoguttaceae bacterium]
MKIKKDDTVVVLSGKYAGQKGRVLKVNKEKELVTVEGVNEV